MTREEFLNWARNHVDPEWTEKHEVEVIAPMLERVAEFDLIAAQLFVGARAAEDALETYLVTRYPELKPS